MGKKSYFEFLEEEFQALTSQLQVSLSAPTTASSHAGMATQFTRCQAVWQQLKQEARKDSEFQDRLGLYQIQLKALQDYYYQSSSSSTSTNSTSSRIPAVVGTTQKEKNGNTTKKSSSAVSSSTTRMPNPASQETGQQQLDEDRQEITFNMWIENPRGRHLLREDSRNHKSGGDDDDDDHDDDE